MKNILFALLFVIFATSCGSDASSDAASRSLSGAADASVDLTALPWDSVLTRAKGQTVQLMMWQGDPLINDYMSDYVTPMVKEQYGVNLEISSGQGSQIVSTLLAEQQAQVSESDIDLMWINGETFFQLREMDALYGPFVSALPNSRYLDLDNPFINTDFQQPTEGYECPWGNVQLCLIYNSDHVAQPPQNLAELQEWVRTHPGKFTIPTDFTGMTLLKSMLANLAGDPHSLDGEFDEARYEQLSKELWEYLNRNKQYFWREGRTFPASVAPMHQLFSNGELWFTMSNNDGEVENKVINGTLPESSRAYTFESGTIQNSHYMGITEHSAAKAGAMAVVNFLISPEAQLRKADPKVWGDGTVLDRSKLPAEMQAKVDSLDQRTYAPPREVLEQNAIQEPAPEYMIRLYEDFRTYVIEAQ